MKHFVKHGETVIDSFEKIAQIGVVPVIAIDNVDHALPLADALLEGGIACAEITFRTAAARAVIEIMARQRPELLVGAGTLLDLPSLFAARDAGATFGLAPGYNAAVVDAAKALSFPFTPGVMTPSEVGACLAAGVTTMKFFPPGSAGGTRMLSSIEAPYAHLKPRFIPTGGVTLENMPDWLSIKSVLAVGGTWIATRDAIAREAWQEITSLCKAASEQVRHIHNIASNIARTATP